MFTSLKEDIIFHLKNHLLNPELLHIVSDWKPVSNPWVELVYVNDAFLFGRITELFLLY